MDAESEAIAAFIQTSTVSMTVADPQLADCPIISSNAAFQCLTGYSHAEINGRNCRFLQGAATEQNERMVLREAIDALRPCQVSLLNFKANGESFHNLLIVEPLQLENGKTLLIGCQFGFDIEVDEGTISSAAVERYVEIDRIQRHVTASLNTDIRVALRLRADAAMASVRNYQTKRRRIT